MAVNETIDRDLGANEIKKRISQMDGSFVTIGVHGGAGKYTEGKNPPEIVDVAFWNEFGTVTAPERSFIRSTVDENKAKLTAEVKFQAAQILKLKTTPKKALDSIGFQVQQLIQGKIETLRKPPNAPSTIAQKPEIGDNPLVDSRLLKRSINFETTVKG